MVLACLLQVLRVACLPLDSLWPAVVTHELLLVTRAAEGCKLGSGKSSSTKVAAFAPGVGGTTTGITDPCSRHTLLTRKVPGSYPKGRSCKSVCTPLTNLEPDRIGTRVLVLPPLSQCSLLRHQRHCEGWHTNYRKRWRRQTLSQNWHRGLHSQPEMFHTTMSPYTNQPTTLWGKREAEVSWDRLTTDKRMYLRIIATKIETRSLPRPRWNMTFLPHEQPFTLPNTFWPRWKCESLQRDSSFSRFWLPDH